MDIAGAPRSQGSAFGAVASTVLHHSAHELCNTLNATAPNAFYELTDLPALLNLKLSAISNLHQTDSVFENLRG